MLSIWDPFSEIERMSRDFDRTFVPRTGRNGARELVPAVDVKEDDKAITVKAELPGIKREDVHVEVDDNVLTLRGERKLEQREEEKGKFYRVERAYGTFTRSFRLPMTVDAQSIGADLKDGVLTLTIPKKPETKPRKIDVKV